MPRKPHVLLAADDAATTSLFSRLDSELRVSAARDPESTLRTLHDSPPDSTPEVVFLDLSSPPGASLALLAEIRRLYPEMEVVILSREGSVDQVVEAMRAGACDFLAKPFAPSQVRVILERVRSVGALRRENRALRDSLRERFAAESLVGTTPEIERVRDLVKRVAPEDVTVLIRGESGTGKDVVARAIHADSPRATKPFVTVDCGAIARNLIESELFGHEKGAFTGAVARKDGLFLRADGGTLFLDEIGEIPTDLQPTILRAIEEKRFRPVGGTKMISSDARIISATNRDLEKAIEAGAFRLDLYYRLNVVQIVIPPLRKRRDDIPLLAEHFVRRLTGDGRHRKVSGVSHSAMLELLRYDWPGNVRELENVLEQAVTLGKHEEIEVEDLPPRVTSASREAAPRPAVSTNLIRPLNDLEKDAILAALAASRGDTKAVSQMLEIDRSTLYRKMKRFGIEVSQFKR